ncbi:polymer-forming cytoskeletal protein [Flavobacterium suaedae]|uniref:polymer-forming cytoskeletal protein n=1 Tax=Flavobacterium suaedae TaxID=1767027 RepID=UPI00166B17B0|nr:polymer-forming cytoskeletal protein [Flavobacterium suaedae]
MIFKWKNKVYSGALQFTIFISVIIAILLAAVVVLFYTHSFFLQQSKSFISTVQLADSGINALKRQKGITLDTLEIPLPDTEVNHSITGHLSHWGIYENAFIKSKHKEKEFIKSSFLGSSKNAVERPALYLKDKSKPLVVVGDAAIRGKAILPERGIKTGSIKGKSYYGTQLVYGTVQQSTPNLPSLQYNYQDICNYYLNRFFPEQGNFIPAINNIVIVNSFNKQVKGFVAEQTIILENTSLTGNIIVRSDKKIIIKNTAKLTDVIIVAPIIEIESGFKGNFQGIASDYIEVNNNVMLSYPTALVLLKNHTTLNTNTTDREYFRKKGKIHIGQGTTVKGTVAYLGQPNSNDYKTNIYINDTAKIKGEVYCEGNLELKGKVAGTAYVNLFVANEGGTVFVNHLYNGSISSSELPEAFGGIVFENEPKTTVKWLY